MAWGKRRLLDVLEVIGRVLVEHQLADRDQGVVSMRPDLGDIKNVPAVLGPFCLGHHLNLEVPLNSFSALDVEEEIASGVVRVRTLELVCSFGGQTLNARA